MGSTIKEVFAVLLAVLIPLAAFTTGLQAPKAGPGEERLWRRPRQLGRDLLAVLILVPLWAVALVLILPVSPLVRAGLLISVLAVGIGPVAGMRRMSAASPRAHEALDLNLTVLLISMVFVPVAFALIAALVQRDFHVGVGAVAKVVLGRALIPLLLGVGAARLFPRAASAAGPWLVEVLNIVLLATLVLALIVSAKFLVGVGALGWIAAAGVAIGAIVIGHLLGGPDSDSRGVVAAASAMRFPALALVLAAALPGGARVIPVVIVYIVVAFLATTIYGIVTARRRKHETPVIPIGAAPRRA